jgi:cobalt/nickel transport system permease protein
MSHLLGTDAGTPAAAAGDASGGGAAASPVASLDPRIRILAACAFALVTVALNDLVVLLLPPLLAVAALMAARLPPGPTLRRMAMMDGFILFLLLLLPFTVPGEPALTVLGRSASWAGIEQALAIALKANAIVLMLLSLVGSMDPTTLGHALWRLRVPENLVHLLLFPVRYIAGVDAEYRRHRRAMQVRCFRLGTNRHSLRSIGYLIGMMLVRALERSERILGAMKCRGFTGRLVLLDDLRLRRHDILFGILFGLGLALLPALERLHDRLA